jgi:hypothetical protein
MGWEGKQNYATRLSSIYHSSAIWITVGTSFLQNTGDVALLELINDFCTSNYPNPKILQSNQEPGGNDFTYIK